MQIFVANKYRTDSSYKQLADVSLTLDGAKKLIETYEGLPLKWDHFEVFPVVYSVNELATYIIDRVNTDEVLINARS